MKAPTEITLQQFPFEPTGYHIGGTYFPGVSKCDNGQYLIRILTAASRSLRGNVSYRYGYFYTDASGLITSTPRGLAKQFKQKVRITDIAEHANASH